MFSADGLKGPLHFLLDVVFAGRTIHLAEQRLTAKLGGEAVEYQPGLEWQRSWPQVLSPYSSDPPTVSVSLTLHMPPDFDVPGLIAEGHNPGSGTGVLSLYSEVDERALVLIDGNLRDPKWLTSDDPVVVTLEQNPREDTGVIQSRKQRVLAATWSDHDFAYNKEYYPLVIGSPSGAKTNYHSGTQAMLVVKTAPNEKVLIAGHHTVAGAKNDLVDISNFTVPGAGETGQAENTFDDLGQPVTTVNVSGFTTPPVAGDKLWVAWRDDPMTTQAYGHFNDDQSGPLRGAGDVLIFLARMSQGLRWDFARLDAVRGRLNQYVLDTYIWPDPGEPISPYDWIQEFILEPLPVSMELGPEGIYVRWWDFTADAKDAEVHLIHGVGGNCSRIGFVGTTPLDDVLGEVIVDYAYNHRTGKPRESVLLSGDSGAVAEDEDGVLDPWLVLSRLEYAERKGSSIRLEAVDERSTAIRIGGAKAKLGGPQRAKAAYEVNQYPGGLLEPGSVALVTDAGLGWVKRPCIVHRAEWSEMKTREILVHVPLDKSGQAV